MTWGDKAKKEVIPSFLFLLSFVDLSRASVIQYSYNKNRGSDMTLPILDNILLHLLAKTRGKTIEEKLDNFFKTSFSLGNFTTLFGAVFALITVLPLPFTRLSESEQLDTELKLRCFVLAIFVGLCISGFSIWVEKHLKKLVYNHATIKINKAKGKEIYSANSNIDLSIYTHDRKIDDEGIFAKEPFPHIKLEHFKNEKIIIKVEKGEQEKAIDGGLVRFLVRNEAEIKNEIATWNVSEEVLVYKIEEVNIIPEFVEKDYKPLPICELEENIQTKIVLTASIDEELVKQFYDKRELEELLTFSPCP